MATEVTTPFCIVSAAEAVHHDLKPALVRVTRRLEREALAHPPVECAATLQDARFLTSRTRRAYADLAARGTRVRLYARSLQTWLAPGVTGVALDDDDPLVDEWTVLLPLHEQPVVFAATDLGDPADDDLARGFRWALSRDPAVVAACAHVLGVLDPDRAAGAPA